MRSSAPGQGGIWWSRLAVYGSWNSYSAPFPGREWRAALRYMATGRLRVEPLITHRAPLSHAKDMWTGQEFFNKVILIP